MKKHYPEATQSISTFWTTIKNIYYSYMSFLHVPAYTRKCVCQTVIQRVSTKPRLRFSFLCALCSQRQSLSILFHFTVAGILCRVMTIKCLYKLYHSKVFIFLSISIFQPILWYLSFGIPVPLKPVLGHVYPCKLQCCNIMGLNRWETPVFGLVRADNLIRLIVIGQLWKAVMFEKRKKMALL